MRRLSRAGFKRDFVRPAIMPDWWNDECSSDPELLPDVEVRLARFLSLPLAVVRDPGAQLDSPQYPDAQLRRVKTVDGDRLGPAIHTAIRIAGAVVRNLRDKDTEPALPPTDAIEWRDVIDRDHPPVKLEDMLDDLWERGIPVVPLDLLPAPSFQGMACIVNDRPVILLGHRHDEPGRVAYFVAHEVGHVVSGHCAAERPVVDEADENDDDTDIETRAEQYATTVLMGGEEVPSMQHAEIDYKSLARHAVEIEKSESIDASAVIFAWARQTSDYATATMAIKALYRHVGARRKLREMFDANVALTEAPESDRALLRCVHGDAGRNETAN